MRNSLLALVAALALVLAASCGDDHDPEHENGHAGRTPDCNLLASRCHPYDTHDGSLPSVCHDIGHDGPAAECTARKDECLAACPEVDGSGGEGGSPATGGSGGASGATGGSGGSSAAGAGGEGGEGGASG